MLNKSATAVIVSEQTPYHVPEIRSLLDRSKIGVERVTAVEVRPVILACVMTESVPQQRAREEGEGRTDVEALFGGGGEGDLLVQKGDTARVLR